MTSNVMTDNIDNTMLYFRENKPLSCERNKDIEQKIKILQAALDDKFDEYDHLCREGNHEALKRMKEIQNMIIFFNFPRKKISVEQIKAIVRVLDPKDVRVDFIKKEHMVDYMYSLSIDYMQKYNNKRHLDIRAIANEYNTSYFVEADTSGPKEKPEYQVISGKKTYKRSETVKKNAIEAARYCCETNSCHRHFVSAVTNKNYVEGHHLIPMEFQAEDEFPYSLDVEENIVSLCVVCHKTLHHAVINEKKPILTELYEHRKDRLRARGINITLERLVDLYNKNINDD